MTQKRTPRIYFFRSIAALVFIAAIFNSTIAFAAIPPIDSGGGSTTPKTSEQLAPINDRAISWSIMKAVVENRCRPAATISQENALNGDLNKNKTTTIQVGHYAKPDDGELSCNDALKLALPLWADGETDAFLKKIGYTYNEGERRYELNGDLNVNAFVAAIPARMFLTTNRNELDYALGYYMFYQSFTIGCQATPYKPIGPAPPTGATSDEKGKVDSDDNTYRIYQVGADGRVQDYIYTDKYGKARVIAVGYGNGTKNAGQADCYELSTLLQNKNYADGYASILVVDPSASTSLAEVNVDEKGNSGCYSGISVFGWILCPILDLADGIYSFLANSVLSLLAMPELSSGSTGLQKSWAAVKNIANVCLILVALFMIGSQIFSFKFVDAYTIKKVLPRLVIAVILIQLSWFLFTGLIELFNALGYGINAIVTAPFETVGKIDIVDLMAKPTHGQAEIAGVFTGTGLAVAGGALALTALSPGGWITIALTAIGVAISVILVILTLVIRKLLLITLLVTAPIALVAWILPNTQKYWTTWWNLFIKLLIMFPLIALLFAMGRIFAVVVANANPTGNTAEGALNTVIVIIAYFAPLFLIPATFKFAGGIFGSVVGGMNNIGGKAKQGGFGLRNRKDAYQKLKNEEKARLIQDSSRRNTAKALDPNAKWTTRQRGKAVLGPAGFIPFGVGKRNVQKAQTRYGAVADQADMQEAGLDYASMSAKLSYDQKVAMSAAVAGSTGTSATYNAPVLDDAGNVTFEKDANGNNVLRNGRPVPIMQSKTVPVNDALRRTAAQYIARAGAVDEVREAMDSLDSGGRQDLSAKILDENVGDLIKTAPDFYGKSAGDVTYEDLSRVKEKTLRNLRVQMGTFEKTLANPGATQAEKQKAQAKLANAKANAEKAIKAYEDNQISISPANLAILQRMKDGDYAPDVEGANGRVDFAGRTEFITDPSGRGPVSNPEFQEKFHL